MFLIAQRKVYVKYEPLLIFIGPSVHAVDLIDDHRHQIVKKRDSRRTLCKFAKEIDYRC